MKWLIGTLFGATFLLAVAAAHAGLIISGGTPSLSGPNNDVIGDNLSGVIGGSLLVDSARGGRVMFDFVGSEAGWNSLFGYAGSSDTIVNHPAGRTWGTVIAADNPAWQQQFRVDVGSGQTPLDFFFRLTSGPMAGQTVANGSSGSGAPNYWLGYDQTGSVLIGLDDGGAGIDGDHDDLVARATYMVPEPRMLALLSIGLAGLVFARRRRSLWST